MPAQLTPPGGRYDVVGVGECLVAFRAMEPGPLYEARSFAVHVAGAEANVCVGLARLGHRSAFVGRVAGDALGRMVLRRLRAEDVDVTAVTVDDGAPAGLQVRETRGYGTSEAFYYRKGSAGSLLNRENAARGTALIEQATWLHLTGITLAISETARDAAMALLGHCRRTSTRVSFDVNYRAKLWRSREDARKAVAAVLPVTNILFGSAEELALLADVEAPSEAATALLREMPSDATIVVKLGARGAMSVAASGAGAAVGPPMLQVVDSIGAGDAFAAGFLSATIDGHGQEAALRAGTACAGFVLGAHGDLVGLPNRLELHRALTSAVDVWR